MDVLKPDQRRLNMSRIRGRDTKPELLLRRGLHRLGLRFRLHYRHLPGRPDLTFPRYRAVLQVHGCFWHGHDCHLFQMPATREAFWRTKIQGNRERDRRTHQELIERGWRVLTVWECATRGAGRKPPNDLLDEAAAFIRGDAPVCSIEGKAL